MWPFHALGVGDSRWRTGKKKAWAGRPALRFDSAFFAVEHLADGAAALFVQLAFNFAGVGYEVVLGGGFGGLRFAAGGAAVGEAGFVGQ